MVRADLSVPGHPDVFVIGDTAAVTALMGNAPGVAPVAKQQGQYVARVLIARYAGRTTAYSAIVISARSPQSAASGGCPIRQAPTLGLSGLGAVERAHVYFLIGFRNRFVVALNWAWSYIHFSEVAVSSLACTRG